MHEWGSNDRHSTKPQSKNHGTVRQAGDLGLGTALHSELMGSGQVYIFSAITRWVCLCLSPHSAPATFPTSALSHIGCGIHLAAHVWSLISYAAAQIIILSAHADIDIKTQAPDRLTDLHKL
jgi:hypothetical protein